MERLKQLRIKDKDNVVVDVPFDHEEYETKLY